MRKPEIIKPGDPLAYARVRDRLAPKPRIHGGLDGWLAWELVDRKGKVVAGGEQHNLFLNAGLDSIAQYSSPLTGEGWMTHACVGTGSTEPDITDTTLDNEIARTATTVAGLNATDFVSDGVYDLSRQWEFGYEQANGNLTEFGIARAGSGQLIVRELIRDVAGNPIALTKTSEFLLRVTYTLRISLSPVLMTPVSLVIDGIGLINGDFMFKRGTTGSADLSVFGCVARGTIVGSGLPRTGRAFAQSVAPSDAYNQNLSISAPAWSTANAESNTWSDYTTGDYERTTIPRFGVAQANGFDIANIAISGTTTTTDRLGYVFRIAAEDRFQKDSDHVLTVELLTVSWDRA